MAERSEYLHFLHVGGYPENDADNSRITEAIRDLLARGWRAQPGRHVFWDLNEGFDFLVLDAPQPLDVLILHWIYDGPNPALERQSYFRISPHHSIVNWHKALLRTTARLIYVFGEEDEISANKIGDLVGYHKDGMRFNPSPGKTVYVRG